MSSTKVKIEYDTIIDRCNQLSAYEGKTAVSGSGKSMYDDIRLTYRENSLITIYINQGLNIIDSEIGCMLKWDIEADVTDSNNKNVIEIDTHSQISKDGKKGSFTRNVIEVLVSYAMHLWLADKVADRSASYKQISTDMLATLRKNAFRKKEPDWEDDL